MSSVEAQKNILRRFSFALCLCLPAFLSPEAGRNRFVAGKKNRGVNLQKCSQLSRH